MKPPLNQQDIPFLCMYTVSEKQVTCMAKVYKNIYRCRVLFQKIYNKDRQKLKVSEGIPILLKKIIFDRTSENSCMNSTVLLVKYE